MTFQLVVGVKEVRTGMEHYFLGPKIGRQIRINVRITYSISLVTEDQAKIQKKLNVILKPKLPGSVRYCQLWLVRI
jgi:hypothetical protein